MKVLVTGSFALRHHFGTEAFSRTPNDLDLIIDSKDLNSSNRLGKAIFLDVLNPLMKRLGCDDLFSVGTPLAFYYKADKSNSYIKDKIHIVVKRNQGKNFNIELSVADSGQKNILGTDSNLITNHFAEAEIFNASELPPHRNRNRDNLEFSFLSPDFLYLQKLSHRYLRNSPHFAKTMDDIYTMRSLMDADCLMKIDFYKDWLKARESLTYNYASPSLDRSKDDFFSDDGITYYLDHDSIHKAVAFDTVPAYEKFKKPGAEVAVDMDKFFELPETVRMQAALEESMVLCVERSLMPFHMVPNGHVNISKSTELGLLKFALEKVCTSITSGRFREYCWENYYAISAMAGICVKHNDGPVARLTRGLDSGIITKLVDF